MNRIESLQQHHNLLTDVVRNLRADLVATGLLNDALIIAMDGSMRATVRHNLQQLGERWIAGALANSEDPTDRTVHAVQRSIGMLVDRLDKLPVRQAAAPHTPNRPA
jgi:hypothetical protein